MSKTELKELIGIILFGTINTFVACLITISLGIYKTVMIKSYSLVYGDITWEVVIFFALSFIESVIYECFNNKILSNKKRPTQ